MTLKIVFVATSLHGGGAEFVARTWARHFVAEHHEVKFITTSGSGEDPSGSDLSVESLEKASGLLGKAGSLARIFTESRPDVVVSLQTYPNLISLLAVRRMKREKRPALLISERNLVSLGIPGSGLAHKSKIRLARSLYRNADEVVAISHPVAAELVSWFSVPGDRCTVVPNPATAKVEGRALTVAGLRAESPITAVLPARLVKQKQPLLAVRSVAELRSRGLDVSIMSFGTGPLLAEVEHLAAELNVPFVHAGWVEKWTEAVPENAFALLASEREGFGNVLVEAAASGIPSVALSNALGVADALIPGISGELALFATPKSVADAVERLVGRTPASLSEWPDRFSVESSSGQLEEVMRRGIARRKSLV